MSETAKKQQLTELLAKSSKFIVANLNAIEKEIYVFVLKKKLEPLMHACQTLRTVNEVLNGYVEPPGFVYEPRVFPQTFVDKVADAKLVQLVSQMDALLALIRAKFVPIVQKIKTGDCDAKVTSDVIKINQILKVRLAEVVLH
jgi:hypothetical protein